MTARTFLFVVMAVALATSTGCFGGKRGTGSNSTPADRDLAERLHGRGNGSPAATPP
jgi:hypothetical protein